MIAGAEKTHQIDESGGLLVRRAIGDGIGAAIEAIPGAYPVAALSTQQRSLHNAQIRKKKEARAGQQKETAFPCN